VLGPAFAEGATYKRGNFPQDRGRTSPSIWRSALQPDSWGSPKVSRKVYETIGEELLLGNVQYFFDLLDECWAMSQTQRRDATAVVHGSFLMAVARLFAEYSDFWFAKNPKRLFLTVPDKAKLRKYKVTDPATVAMSRTTGSGNTLGSLDFSWPI
jgi:hypothetical protein